MQKSFSEEWDNFNASEGAKRPRSESSSSRESGQKYVSPDSTKGVPLNLTKPRKEDNNNQKRPADVVAGGPGFPFGMVGHGATGSNLEDLLAFEMLRKTKGLLSGQSPSPHLNLGGMGQQLPDVVNTLPMFPHSTASTPTSSPMPHAKSESSANNKLTPQLSPHFFGAASDSLRPFSGGLEYPFPNVFGAPNPYSLPGSAHFPSFNNLAAVQAAAMQAAAAAAARPNPHFGNSFNISPESIKDKDPINSLPPSANVSKQSQLKSDCKQDKEEDCSKS